MALARVNHTSSGKVPTGQASEVVINDASFRSAHRAFEANTEPPSKKRKREGRGDASILFGEGSYKGPWARREAVRPDVVDPDESGDEEVEYVYEEDEIAPQPAAPASKAGTSYGETGNGKETSEFHGSEMHDYQGRTYMHVPPEYTRDIEIRSYPPKPDKLVKTLKGHTKSITQTRFFPATGHLLLSGSADAKVMLWDMKHPYALLRTFSGHSKYVTDVDFAPDGARFLSGSYDRMMKQWDTETGACLARFSTGATPHCLRVNPAAPAEFLAGTSDKKIVQFDVRAGAKPVQEYDHHLGAVNTITFVDAARRFLTTSDDKSLRAWEYGINVPIKYVADPSMHALVRAAPHPSGKYVLFQSQDNSIVTYAAGDKFRQKREKRFEGHNVAGGAPDVAVSPDGEWVASGDSAGWVCFWSWKTRKLEYSVQTAGAKAGPTGAGCVTVVWHPRERSRVVTGGQDGNLKLWDQA